MAIDVRDIEQSRSTERAECAPEVLCETIPRGLIVPHRIPNETVFPVPILYQNVSVTTPTVSDSTIPDTQVLVEHHPQLQATEHILVQDGRT